MHMYLTLPNRHVYIIYMQDLVTDSTLISIVPDFRECNVRRDHKSCVSCLPLMSVCDLCVCTFCFNCMSNLKPTFPSCLLYVRIHTCICCNTCSPHRGTACEDVVYIHCTCKHTFECADSLDMYCIYRCTCTCALKHAF